MKEAIAKLRDAETAIMEEQQITDTTHKEHGSHDQTRAILLESLFVQIRTNIKEAINLAAILNREMY